MNLGIIKYFAIKCDIFDKNSMLDLQLSQHKGNMFMKLSQMSSWFISVFTKKMARDSGN